MSEPENQTQPEGPRSSDETRLSPERQERASADLARELLCSHCEQRRRGQPAIRAQEFSFRGEAIRLEIPVLVCAVCGADELDPTFGDPAELVYEEYQRRRGATPRAEL